MSAVVCGKRSFFDDIHQGSPPGNAKRIRCGGGGGTSPGAAFFRSGPNPSENGPEFSRGGPNPPEDGPDTLDQMIQLQTLFPHFESQFMSKVLEACGYNFEQAVKCLSELRPGEDQRASDTFRIVENSAAHKAVENSHNAIAEDSCVDNQRPSASAPESMECVDLLVREMLNATDLDNARARAMEFLKFFEKNYLGQAGAFVAALQKENAGLKSQAQGLLKDNHILKRAVAIQHSSQVEHDQRAAELQQLNHLLANYQGRIRTLEMNNYALSVHLRKAQGEEASIPDRFNPDVF